MVGETLVFHLPWNSWLCTTCAEISCPSCERWNTMSADSQVDGALLPCRAASGHRSQQHRLAEAQRIALRTRRMSRGALTVLRGAQVNGAVHNNLLVIDNRFCNSSNSSNSSSSSSRTQVSASSRWTRKQLVLAYAACAAVPPASSASGSTRRSPSRSGTRASGSRSECPD